MKKHFLLLVMALMSMTAWAAQDISGFAIRTEAVPYGTTITADDITVRDAEFATNLTAGTDFTLVGVYSDAACQNAVTGLLPVKTYYVKVEGTGAYSGTKTASIDVVKKEVLVTLTWSKGNVPLYKTYGEADPTFEINWAGAAFETGDTKAVFTGTAALATHAENVKYNDVDAVIGVDIELTGLTAANYTVKLNPASGSSPTYNFAQMVINPKAITEDNFGAATNLTASLVYSGAEAAPSYTIKDGEYTLVAKKDYEIAVSAGSETATLPAGVLSGGKAINVGHYGVKVTGKGNYTTNPTGLTTDPGVSCSLDITKAPMSVAVKNIEVPYKAEKYTAIPGTSKIEFSFYGFVGQDVAYSEKLFDGETVSESNPEDASYVAPTVALVSTEGLTDAGSYTLTLTGGSATNYNFNLITTGTEAGKFVIKPFALRVSAQSKEKTVGQADPKLTFATDPVTGTVIPRKVTNQAAIDAATAAGTTAPAAEYEPLWTTEPTLTRAPGESKGEYAISFATNGTPAANYSVAADKYTASIVKDGEIKNDIKFTINPAAATITVLNHTKVYGSADPVEFENPVAGKDYIVSGMKEGETLSNVKLVRVTEAAADAEKVGNHSITATFDEVGSDYTGVTIIPGNLEITKATLTIVIQDQTLKIGQTADNLDQNLVTVIGNASGDAVNKILTLKFSSDVVSTATTSGTGALNAAGTYNNGIIFEAYSGADSKAANYTFPNVSALTDAQKAALFGNLIVVNPSTTIVLNRAAKADYSDATKNNTAKVIADAAAACAADATKKYTVTFGDFAMLPEKWYPIVLPFATTVAEVSQAFGYAVVNVLNKENTDDKKIAFKLHMQEIKANEPFVVKISAAKNMNEVKFGVATGTEKKIVNSENPIVTDQSGVKFIGTYTGKTDGFRENQYYFSTSADYNDYYKGNATNTTYLRPLGAYFEVPATSAARVIEFEEADGTVTAISAVAFENGVTSAEGWYTIGGMKLQGAPTQKGIYIQNGKKVIVK